MALTFTLAGNSLNDGSTYTLEDGSLEIDQLAVTGDEVLSYVDGSTNQVNVKTKGAADVRFSLKVAGASAAAVDTAFDNLVSWVVAGGALVISDGATSILSCTVGASQPPTRPVSTAYLINHYCFADVTLRRLT